MLIESRLPKKSLVSGNIDYAQCVKAKQWTDQFLSSPIEIPVQLMWTGYFLETPT